MVALKLSTFPGKRGIPPIRRLKSLRHNAKRTREACKAFRTFPRRISTCLRYSKKKAVIAAAPGPTKVLAAAALHQKHHSDSEAKELAEVTFESAKLLAARPASFTAMSNGLNSPHASSF